jgi:hypothetical protein
MADGVLKIRVGGAWQSVPTLGPVGPVGPQGPKGDTGEATAAHHASHEPGGADQIVKLTLTSAYPQLRLESPTPMVLLSETDQAVDAKKWRLYGNNSALVIDATPDAEVGEVSTPLTLYRDGTVMMSKPARPELQLRWEGTTAKARIFMALENDVRLSRNVVYSGTAFVRDNTAQTAAILEMNSINNSLVYMLFPADGSASTLPFVVGTGNPTMKIAGPSASISLYDTAGAADAKLFKWQISGGNLSLYTLNDADSVVQVTPVTFNRDKDILFTAKEFRLQGTSSYARMHLRDPTAAAGSQTFVLLNYTGKLYISAASTDDGLYPISGAWENGLVVERDGSISSGWNIWSKCVIYPGQYDTGWTKQSSWWLGSHSAYGLYSNTGLYLAGQLTVAGTIGTSTNIWRSNIHSTGYMYPGRMTETPDYQTNWYIAGHSSYGLYINTGLYTAGGIWAENVTLRAGASISGTLTVNVVNVNAGNITVSGNIHNAAGFIYPGQWGSGAYQGSWYLSSHGSYGLITNTGLNVQGAVWCGHMYMSGDIHIAQLHTGNTGKWVGLPDNGNFPGSSGNNSTNSGWVQMRHPNGTPIYLPYWY